MHVIKFCLGQHQGHVSLYLFYLEFLQKQEVCGTFAHRAGPGPQARQNCWVRMTAHLTTWLPLWVWPHPSLKGAISPRVASSLACWASAILAATRFCLNL